MQNCKNIKATAKLTDTGCTGNVIMQQPSPYNRKIAVAEAIITADIARYIYPSGI